jgi:hypothetical protein
MIKHQWRGDAEKTLAQFEQFAPGQYEITEGPHGYVVGLKIRPAEPPCSDGRPVTTRTAPRPSAAPEKPLTRKERNALRRIKYGRTGSKTKHATFIEACDYIRATEGNTPLTTKTRQR